MPSSRDKHHRRSESESPERRRRRSESSESTSSSSSSSSESEKVECYSNDKSDSDSYKCKPKFDMCEIYTYFKNRLVEDEDLMVYGSDSYLTAVNYNGQNIVTTRSATFDQTILSYGADRYPTGASCFVRESGVFILFFICTTDSSCQFTIFVNNIPQYNTCVGTNSGAGQLVTRHMLELRKNDNVVVRNYTSTTPNVISAVGVGGTEPGNDLSFLIMKIATLPMIKKCDEQEECLSERKKKLFCNITKKLLCDSELMVRGFNVTGSFNNISAQSVPLEADLVFNAFQNVNGLLWNPTSSNPEQIKVLEDGVYKIFFLVTTNTAAQFTIMVNGVPLPETTQGTNKGAGQLSIRTLQELRANDIITVRNHSSSVGTVQVSANAGGYLNTIATNVTIFKIANLVKPCVKPVSCEVAKHFECYYPLLKKYLLKLDYLALTGSPGYASMTSASVQTIPIGSDFHWSTNVIDYDGPYHVQGENFITIQTAGTYDLFADIITDQPPQFTLFVNGVPDNSTIFGRDSGANRCLLRQIVKFNKGDVVTLKNYSSNAGTLTTAENPGGLQVGQSCMFMLFMLSPSALPPVEPCEPCIPHSPKHCEEKKECDSEKKHSKKHYRKCDSESEKKHKHRKHKDESDSDSERRRRHRKHDTEHDSEKRHRRHKSQEKCHKV